VSNFKRTVYRCSEWLAAVAQIPCVFCGKPAQVAHRNKGKGMGIKTDDCQTAALCLECHHDIDNGPDMTRDQRRARMDEAIVLTLTAMVEMGLVAPVKDRLKHERKSA
jgi:hypothetical protein